MPSPSQRRRVSVVMPVHNALPHLDGAVRSILDQSDKELEFVIYDDQSTDGSTERLRQLKQEDARITLYEGGRNLGPALSSNFVVSKAHGDLIARMDADDLSHPDRIARQVELFDQHSSVGLVGTLCDIIDHRSRQLRKPEMWRLTRRSFFAPFPHGSIMLRRDIFDQVGGYRRECVFWEDQDLVMRIARVSDILVIPDALYFHRQSSISTRIASDPDRVERAVDLAYRCIDEVARSGDYEAVLKRPEPAGARIDPRVFVALGSLRLWAEGRPRQLARLLRRGELGPNSRSLLALVWAGWAEVSPSSLRSFLGLLVRVRGLGARRGKSMGAIRWSPPKVPSETERSASLRR